MQHILGFANGPLFIAAFSLMVLGLGRLVFLKLYLRSILWFKDHTGASFSRQSFRSYIDYVFPPRRIPRLRPLLGAAGLLLHAGIIAVPLFLTEHILLWKSGIGVGWPSMGRSVADFLTLTTIITSLALLGLRAFHGPSRKLSRPQDYLLLLAVLAPFATGYIAMHPQFLFTRIETMLLVHVLSGELLFVLMPFTKLSHVALILFERAFSEFYLRAPVEGREQLGREFARERVER